MRGILLLVGALMTANVFAAESSTVNFNFKNEDITKVIEEYSKISGQRFIIGPEIKGHITLINPTPISLSEAFNQLSSALALNGLGIKTEDGVMTVMQARALQRSDIDVGATLPPLKPEKMYTWVVTLKYADADDVNKQLRILTSRDGELVPYIRNNQIWISDWVSNLHRIDKIIKEIDVPATPDSAKRMAHHEHEQTMFKNFEKHFNKKLPPGLNGTETKPEEH